MLRMKPWCEYSESSDVVPMCMGEDGRCLADAFSEIPTAEIVDFGPGKNFLVAGIHLKLAGIIAEEAGALLSG